MSCKIHFYLYSEALFYEKMNPCSEYGSSGVHLLPDPVYLRQLYPAERVLGYRGGQPVHGRRRGGGRGGGGGPAPAAHR